MFRIKVRDQDNINNNGDYVTQGPIRILFEAGFGGSDFTPPDPYQVRLQAPPHTLHLYDSDSVEVTITEEG